MVSLLEITLYFTYMYVILIIAIIFMKSCYLPCGWWNNNNNCCYIPRLSLSKMSIVIGWFLVTCPWSNSNVFNCAVVARVPNTTARDQFKTKFKMALSSVLAYVSLIGDCEWGSCASFLNTVFASLTSRVRRLLYKWESSGFLISSDDNKKEKGEFIHSKAC